MEDIRKDVEGERKKKRVDFAKAAEKAAKEKNSAFHAFAGNGPLMDSGTPAAVAGGSGQGRNQFVFAKPPRSIKMPMVSHPPFPRPPGVPEEVDIRNDEETDRGLLQGNAALQRLKKTQSRKALNDEEEMSFFDDSRRSRREVSSSTRVTSANPRQSVCPMGNACFSQTSYSDEQYASSEKTLQMHMKLKHPNAAWELGTDTEGLTLERVVDSMVDNNDAVLAAPRFWEVPSNTAAVAQQLPRLAQGVTKFNPLRDYGIAINSDSTWNKLADRHDTSLKLKTFTHKSLKADPKRSRMQAFNDEEGNSAVVSEDVTHLEPVSASDAFDAILTWVAARRVAFPVDMSPVALQKAISEAYFKQRLPKEGYAQVFSDYLLESANKARLKLPPPQYHEVRQMVEHACIDGRAGRAVTPTREAREPRVDWRVNTSPRKNSPFKKPFTKNTPQAGDKKDRRNYCHSFNAGSCAGAQPGGACTHEGRSYFHLCSLYVDHGLCGEAHSRRSHEKTLG